MTDSVDLGAVQSNAVKLGRQEWKARNPKAPGDLHDPTVPCGGLVRVLVRTYLAYFRLLAPPTRKDKYHPKKLFYSQLPVSIQVP